MKIFYFKKRYIFMLSIILLLGITISVTLVINTNKKDNNLHSLDNIIPQEECECNDSTKMKENDEFLKEQYKNKKLVALTFDDGPSEYTSTLIDELKKRNVVATFFVLGKEVEKKPEALKFAFDTGNEIGIHSYEHKLFTKLSEEEILLQVSKAKDIISNITEKKPNLIRVPYGSINKKIKKVLSDHELTSVLWNVDSLDWKLRNTQKIYDYVMKKFKGNDIILMHDSFKTSIEAATLIIDTLQNKCYTFVTVSEFLRIKNEMKS